MPTPYGSRGGMAFGADELRVLRRALAAALHPAPLGDDDIRACLALAESVDEAVREAGRLRAFLLADLARYRAALPGSVTGYLELLQDALAAGYEPVPDDLAGLRALRGNPVAAALLERCRVLAERSVRARLAGRAAEAAAAPPGPRTRLLTLIADRSDAGAGPYGHGAADSADGPSEARMAGKDGEDGKGDKADDAGKGGDKRDGGERKEPAKPARPAKPGPRPGHRPVPKPSEVFPPRRKPVPPPQERVAG